MAGKLCEGRGSGRPPKFCEAHRSSAARSRYWRETSPLVEQHRRADEAYRLVARAEKLEREVAALAEGRVVGGDGRWQREQAARLRAQAAELTGRPAA